MESRVFWYNSGPKLSFRTYQEKRAFKQAVRKTLREQFGYGTEVEFLRDVYRILASGDGRRLIEFLEKRLSLYTELRGDGRD